MSKPICYLHVGIGKTGSSAIQYALTKAHDHLLSCGLHYPDISNNFKQVLKYKTTAGNAGKLRKILKHNGRKDVMRLLSPFSARPENLVLSCEGFSRLPFACLEELAHGLDILGYDIRCLVFFRPQAESLVSRYLQKVKGNKTYNKTLDDYIAHMLSPDRFDRVCNWYILAQKLAKAFGDQNITTKWYPAVLRTQSPSVVKTTMNWLGVSLPNDCLDEEDKIINPTPGREALVILERLNSLGWGNINFSGNFLSKAHRQGVLGSKVSLSPSLIEEIDTTTRDSNTKLLKRYCPELSVKNELDSLKKNQQAVAIDTNKIDKLEKIALHIFRKSISAA
ncbi:MAG: hypothetical protein QM496_11670 [Verrucomicrobiota bacterium]